MNRTIEEHYLAMQALNKEERDLLEEDREYTDFMVLYEKKTEEAKEFMEDVVESGEQVNARATFSPQRLWIYIPNTKQQYVIHPLHIKDEDIGLFRDFLNRTNIDEYTKCLLTTVPDPTKVNAIVDRLVKETLSPENQKADVNGAFIFDLAGSDLFTAQDWDRIIDLLSYDEERLEDFEIVPMIGLLGECGIVGLKINILYKEYDEYGECIYHSLEDFRDVIFTDEQIRRLEEAVAKKTEQLREEKEETDITQAGIVKKVTKNWMRQTKL